MPQTTSTFHLIPNLIVEAAKEFESHLHPDNNERILFSGKYGKGKTTFLLQFFNENKRLLELEDHKYFPIYLDPVNYSVATNEDIFRYIKYDVIFSLLTHNPEIEDIEFPVGETAAYYAARHPEQFIRYLIEFAPKVGKPISEFIAAIEKLYSKITAFQKSVNEQTEAARLVSFLDRFNVEEGSIYESDLITVLIQKILESTKGTKKSVLVIDNLDRIDPEHIFRILNVFSVHMDYHRQTAKTNKFGFDKIVLVCDIHNIRNIFKNRYGIDVDFNGYIDKFFSTSIYYFQNYKQIEETVKKIVSELKVQTYFREETLTSFTSRYRSGLYNLLSAFVYHNIVSLRQVFNLTATTISDIKEEIRFQEYLLEVRKDNPVLEMIILSKLLGGFRELEKAIQKLSQADARIKDLDLQFKRLLYFDIRHLHKFETITISKPITIDGQIYYAEIVSNGSEFGTFNIFIPASGSVRDYFQPEMRNFYTLYLKILNELHNEKIIE